MNTPHQRSAIGAAIASINRSHVQFWQENQKINAAPYQKLLDKVLSYLHGELKSKPNLLRFHEEFCLWRDSVEPADNLAYRIFELCCSALHSAIESLLDPECDDIELLLGSLTACWAELDELGGDASGLSAYWEEILQEILVAVTPKSKIPLPNAYFLILKNAEVSLFGME